MEDCAALQEFDTGFEGIDLFGVGVLERLDLLLVHLFELKRQYLFAYLDVVHEGLTGGEYLLTMLTCGVGEFVGKIVLITGSEFKTVFCCTLVDMQIMFIRKLFIAKLAYIIIICH
jgi:hypothetical protein